VAEATNDLIYEVLKKVQADVASTKLDIEGMRHEIISMRGHMLSIQTDIHNMYAKLARHDEQLDRIERRLEIRELAEPQRPFEP
jgi:hypothetical protein